MTSGTLTLQELIQNRWSGNLPLTAVSGSPPHSPYLRIRDGVPWRGRPLMYGSEVLYDEFDEVDLQWDRAEIEELKRWPQTGWLLVRTSESDPIRVDWIEETKNGGRLGVTFAPGKRAHGRSGSWERDLQKDLERLHELGVRSLLNLIPSEERYKTLRIAGLVAEARSIGIGVSDFPIEDGGVPEMEAALSRVRRLADSVRQGRRIAVFCRGGLGRSGTIAACALLELHPRMKAVGAIARVRKARGPGAIERGTQVRFVEDYEGCRPPR